MSLSAEPTYSDLKGHFVCGYRNIMGERYAGNSGTHTMKGNAVDTTNGAGSHNIQMFVMDPDGTVLHCLPGYWNSADLATELDFARKLDFVYRDGSLSPQQKTAQFRQMQLAHVRMHSSDMHSRSQLQHFDMKAEAKKGAKSDFIADLALATDPNWGPQSYGAFKTTDEVMHERMAQRPFLSYARFDVGRYVDYGTHTYDKHEDSLDESGRMVGDPHSIQWIKTGNATQQARLASQPRRPVSPKVYVRTYGSVRPDALRQQANN